MSDNLFQSKLRNRMMYYDLENQGVISIENIEKTFMVLLKRFMMK